ncbi:SecDF P1 head subdomain-containing protein [Chitinophagaceae bacterium LWZ2-11]
MKKIVLKSALLSVVVTVIIFFAYKAFLSSKLSGKVVDQTFNVKYNISIADNHNKAEALAQIRKRCASSNYKYDLNSTDSDKLSIKFYKVSDTSSLHNLLFNTSSVEFRSMYTFADLNDGLKKIDFHRENKKVARSIEKKIIDSSNVSDFNAEPAQDSNNPLPYLIAFRAYDNIEQARRTAVLGYVNAKDTIALNKVLSQKENIAQLPPDIQFQYGLIEDYESKRPNEKIYILYAVKTSSLDVLTGNENIKEAVQDFDEGGRPCIKINFTPVGTKLFEDLTRKNLGLPIGIIVNNEVVSAPTVNGVIETGNIQISGSNTVAQAQLLAKQLNSNKSFLPITISLLQVQYETATDQVSSYGKMTLAVIASFAILFGLFFLVFRFIVPVKS